MLAGSETGTKGRGQSSSDGGWGRQNISLKKGEAADRIHLCTRNSVPSLETRMTSASGALNWCSSCLGDMAGRRRSGTSTRRGQSKKKKNI